MQRDYEAVKKITMKKKKRKPNLQVLWEISRFCWTILRVRLTEYLKLEGTCKDHLLLTGWSGTKPASSRWTWTGSNSSPGALVFNFFFTYLNQNMTRGIFQGVGRGGWKIKKNLSRNPANPFLRRNYKNDMVLQYSESQGQISSILQSTQSTSKLFSTSFFSNRFILLSNP